MRTKKTYNGLTGKQLLALIPNDTIGKLDHDGETYILTPRKFIFNNLVDICGNEDAEAVGVLGRFHEKEVLVKF